MLRTLTSVLSQKERKEARGSLSVVRVGLNSSIPHDPSTEVLGYFQSSAVADETKAPSSRRTPKQRPLLSIVGYRNYQSSAIAD
jgi:hypothetical protein